MSATAGHVEQPLSAATADESARALTPAELAWVALLPCALLTLAAILLLGAPLGHALFPRGSDALWPPTWWAARGRPEPVKHARYLLAMGAPLLLAAIVLAGARRPPRLPPRTTRLLARAGQALLLAFVVVGALGQQGVISSGSLELPPTAFFGPAMLAAAAALTAGALLALRRERVAQHLAGLARETTARGVASWAIASSLSAVWLLEAVTTDRLVEDQGQFNWTLNDAFAVLDGRTPLVDYSMPYGKLTPYPSALALDVFGTTAFVYTTFLAVLSALALLAVYATFRRVAGSSLLGLGLFAPFLALGDVHRTMTQAGMWPMRYGGAYVVAWLTARQLDGARPRQRWVLFLAGGLVAINTVEFGLGVVAGSLAALLCARPPHSVREAARLAGACAAGVLAAVALVCAGTLLRAGVLPDPALLSEWPRIFTNLGWFALPVPLASLHLAVYATFAATVVVAAVRVARGAADRLLTGMLMWSGVFGLVAGSYYVGRAEDTKLAAMLSACAFSLALLTVACVHALAARGWRRPTLAQLLVLLGFALAACTLVWIPSPVTQLRRLTSAGPAATYRASAERFVRERTQPGEKVAILFPEGHRIAYDLGLENVSPFGLENAVVTRHQMRTLIDTIQREGVTEVFVPAVNLNLDAEGASAPEQIELFEAEGYPVVGQEERMLELRRGS